MIAVAGIVAAFQIGKLPAALPALRAELGLTLVEAGWIVSALAAVGVATGMIWGFVADRFGHRRMLLSGLGVIGAGTALGSLAETGAMLFATRVVEGCGYVAVLTAGPTVIGAFCRERDRPMALGLWA
ncbi:MAG: MFS transporter, partial [Defluviicoccus sp.]|nr:MFS transporter [Defluviicoccus sp.]